MVANQSENTLFTHVPTSMKEFSWGGCSWIQRQNTSSTT